MQINSTKFMTVAKTFLATTALTTGVIMCHNSKQDLTNAYKNSIKENVDPELYEAIDNDISESLGDETELWGEYYNKIKPYSLHPQRSYFEAEQNINSNN